MATREVHCLHCKHKKVFKHGLSSTLSQRYRCANCKKTFLLDYKNKGALKSVKAQIIKMSINGSGIRDTARVLQVSTDTVISTLKKSV